MTQISIYYDLNESERIPVYLLIKSEVDEMGWGTNCFYFNIRDNYEKLDVERLGSNLQRFSVEQIELNGSRLEKGQLGIHMPMIDRRLSPLFLKKNKVFRLGDCHKYEFIISLLEVREKFGLNVQSYFEWQEEK